MPGSRTPVSTFLDRLQDLRDLWQFGDLRYSAFKQGGEWRNLATQLILAWERPSDSVHPPTVPFDELLVGRHILSRDEATSLLRSAENGDFLVPGAKIRMDSILNRGDPVGQRTQRPAWNEWYLDRSSHAQGVGQGVPDALSGYATVAYGERFCDIIDVETWTRIRYALLQATPAYAGFEDLTSNFELATEALTWGHQVRFQCTAPLGTQFSRWDLTEGTLSGTVVAPSTVKAGDLRISAILRRLDNIDRLGIAPGDFRLSRDSGLGTASYSIPIANYSGVDLHLMLRGIEVDQLRLSLPTLETVNPRVVALTALDRVPLLLNQTLDEAPRLRSVDRLETLTAWVLHLCGFQVMGADTGSSRGKAGLVCDLVAFDPYSNGVAVLDVTTSEPLDNAKLVKVRLRTDAVAAKLPGFDVYGVVVVPGRDSFHDEEADQATRASVRLLSRSDLIEMMEYAQRNEMPQTVASRFFSLARA